MIEVIQSVILLFLIATVIAQTSINRSNIRTFKAINKSIRLLNESTDILIKHAGMSDKYGEVKE